MRAEEKTKIFEKLSEMAKTVRNHDNPNYIIGYCDAILEFQELIKSLDNE